MFGLLKSYKIYFVSEFVALGYATFLATIKESFSCTSKFVICLLFVVLIGVEGRGQTTVFSNTVRENCDSWNSSNSWATSLKKTIVVSGLASPMSSCMALREVRVQLGNSNCVGNLSTYFLRLTSPSGQVINLAGGSGLGMVSSSNSMWVNMKFRDDPSLEKLVQYQPSVQVGYFPHSIGYYALETDGQFDLLNGSITNGNWLFEVIENTATEVSFEKVELVFGPKINIVNYVDPTNKANDLCTGAFCIANGSFRGSNDNYTNGDPLYPGNIVNGCEWNGANNNSAWYYFIPDQTTAKITLSGIRAVTTGSNDMQAIIIKANGNCLTPTEVPIGGCPDNESINNSSYLDPDGTNTLPNPGGTLSSGNVYVNGITENCEFNLSGLTVGQKYFLIVDGNGGNSSDYYIEFENGSSSTSCFACPTITVSGQTTLCAGSASVTYTQTGSTACSWVWSVSPSSAGVINANTGVFTPAASLASPVNAVITYNDGTCSGNLNITVNPVPPAPTVTSPIKYCYGAAASALTATASTGGTLNWYGTNAVGGTAGSTPIPTTATPGSTTYYVSQTVNGCEGPRAAITVTVNEPIVIYAHGTNPTCPGICDGTATVDVTGGAAPYTYSWNNGQMTRSISGLCAGTYTVTVRDANNCTSSSTPVTYTCPQVQSILVDACYFDPSLEGYEEMVFFQNGNSDLTVNNPTFSVTWPPSTNPWNSLCAPNASYISAANATIPAGSGGSLIPVSPGGTIPANANVVLITSNFLTSPYMSFSNLKGPLYVITQCSGASNVAGHFANGSATGTRQITLNFSGSCSESVTYSTTSLIDINGSTGGTSDTRNGAYVNFSPSGNASYENYGCSIPYTIQSNQVVLTVPLPLTATVSSTNVTCNGISANGTITVTASAGTAPYQYSNDGGVTYQSSNLFTGLPAGTYQIRVKDANNCTFSTSVVITAAAALVLTSTQTNATCTGAANGAIDLSVSGGTPTLVLTDLNTVTQNFNTLANSGTTSSVFPTGWSILEIGGNTTYTIGTGSGTTGDSYSFGSTSSSDRALGGIRSGSNNPIIGASFTNTTGQTVTQLAITYVGEQWRLGATDRTDRLEFQYSTDATTLNNGTWVSVNALNFTAPVQSGTVAALDGNSSTNRTTITSVISGLNIPAGSTFRIRWLDYDATGADDGLGIDDFSLTMRAPVSNNTYSYSWSNGATIQDISGLTAGDYTVTVTDASGCTGTKTVTITETTPVTPTFSFPTTVCTGATSVPTLPNTSNNGITGTWSPSTVSNSAGATYTFTPTAGLCANTANVFISVNPCSYGTFASAVYLTQCTNNTYSSTFYNTSGSGVNLINQTPNTNFSGTNLGTYVQNSGTLKLDGAEIKTFKDAGANVCVPIMYYIIYSGTRPASPVFTPLTINFYQNCSGSSFPPPNGAPCSGNDQKWQTPGSGSSANIDLTNLSPGTYSFEVYYEIPGDISSTSLCRNVSYLNNGGSNYSASFTIVAPTAISYTPSALCTSVSSSIPTVTGITGGTYSATPSGLSINTTTGTINPSLSTPRTYTVSYSYNDAQGCPFVRQTSVTINPVPTPPTLTGSEVCPPLSTGSITSGATVTGLNYQLYNSSNQTIGSPLSGGSSLTWSSVPVGTGYYAVATNTTTGCTSANSNTAAVTQKPQVITSIIQTN
jgi:hypothetical protein